MPRPIILKINTKSKARKHPPMLKALCGKPAPKKKTKPAAEAVLVEDLAIEDSRRPVRRRTALHVKVLLVGTFVLLDGVV